MSKQEEDAPSQPRPLLPEPQAAEGTKKGRSKAVAKSRFSIVKGKRPAAAAAAAAAGELGKERGEHPAAAKPLPSPPAGPSEPDLVSQIAKLEEDVHSYQERNERQNKELAKHRENEAILLQRVERLKQERATLMESFEKARKALEMSLRKGVEYEGRLNEMFGALKFQSFASMRKTSFHVRRERESHSAESSPISYAASPMGWMSFHPFIEGEAEDFDEESEEEPEETKQAEGEERVEAPEEPTSRFVSFEEAEERQKQGGEEKADEGKGPEEDIGEAQPAGETAESPISPPAAKEGRPSSPKIADRLHSGEFEYITFERGLPNGLGRLIPPPAKKAPQMPTRSKSVGSLHQQPARRPTLSPLSPGAAASEPARRHNDAFSV
ncbi:unnamed protein product [Vitrella brassicaformis CCMP3155]|uniref:Uncharacterized protein n=1 Tax=Vitrella brassicaformis (strain CCMP3155) TaxID=1169540 RepID=A0A0G4GUB9_VITBC|nr:unnamed protein product [Vitrella brassicaformis CCMP3155]|eukprot:CEM34430.1 unnamed protein product [Vitrella brassicaformis CCMP3155]